MSETDELSASPFDRWYKPPKRWQGALVLFCRTTLVIVIVFVLAACGGAEDPSASTTESEIAGNGATSEAEVIEQDVDKRTYSDWSLEKFEIAKPPSIGDIEQLRIFDDRIFVYDLAEMNIKRYALNGELEAVYGEGRGQGPGEFQNIFSLWARDQEVVWIVDSMSRTVSRFQYDGTFVDSFKPEFMPARIAALHEDSLVILAYMQPELFALVNEEGEVQKNFSGMVGETPNVPTMVFDGHLFPRLNGGFIWAPRFASYLFFYSDEAHLERRMELIDGHTFPIDQLRSNPTQMSAAHLEQPHRTLAVSVTDEEIFVNTLIREEETPFTVLDRYDRASGKYLDSAHIPREGRQYLIHDGMIYSGGADTTLWAFTYLIPQ